MPQSFVRRFVLNWYISMKNNRQNIKNIITTLIFSVIWFTAVFVIFGVPAFNSDYQHPNVQVQLSKHLIGLRGISETDNNLSWSVIEDVRVIGRYDGYIEFSSDHQAYVDFDKTVLRDSLRDDQNILSAEEIDALFVSICSGSLPELEIENLPQLTYGLSTFTVDVKGRYEGVIALTTNRLIPETETNISQVLKSSPTIPWASISGIIISSVLFTVVVWITIRKFSKYKLCIPAIGVIMVLLIALACFYACRMK